MKGKQIKVLVAITFLMMITLVAWSMRDRIFPKKNNPSAQIKAPKDSLKNHIVYDSVLVKKFSDECKRFNMKSDPLTYSGTVNVTDGADTADHINNMRFLYARIGNDYYLKNGDTETLNAQGVYLYIEHAQKRILISKQKDIPEAPLPDMSGIVDKMQSEHYNMQDKKTGSYETIALLNEHHITCKEYAITFDTLSQKMHSVTMRLSFFSDPLNKKKDKVISMIVNRYENKADVNSFPDKNKIVEKDDDGWKLTGLYKGYKLIQVP